MCVRSSVRVSLAVLASAAVSVAVAQNSSATANSGRQLFESFQCWQCHGYEGQGGVGPRLAATVYPFEAFARLVRHTTLMPAYSPNVLSDDELRAIWDFVRAQPEPPALDDIPEMGAR
jgi:mono/diheme cytochrome c family protein